jgi:hypothetical protein
MTIKWIVYPQDPPPLPTAGSIREDDVTRRTDEPDLWLRPAIRLICLTQDCRRFEDQVTILPKVTMPGVLEVPTYICADCLMELARVTDKEEHSDRS